MAYKLIKEHHEKSTRALMEASELLSYITSTKLGPSGDWKGPTHLFILHWKNQVKQYHQLIDPKDYFSDGVLMNMLQNAIYPIEELRSVRKVMEMDRTKSGGTLTFDQYSQLLKSAAIDYDSQFEKKSTKKYLHTYNHEIDYGLNYEQDSDLEVYDLDTPVRVVQVHVHQCGDGYQSNCSPSMNGSASHP